MMLGSGAPEDAEVPRFLPKIVTSPPARTGAV